MADSARARRLAKRIVAIVATELQHQVKDPRLAMVTVTAATVTPDLREATVFYTVYGDEGEITGTAAALASATGVLRSAVGQQTGIKFTPTLAFKLDTVPGERLPDQRTAGGRPIRGRRGRRAGGRRELRGRARSLQGAQGRATPPMTTPPTRVADEREMPMTALTPANSTTRQRRRPPGTVTMRRHGLRCPAVDAAVARQTRSTP